MEITAPSRVHRESFVETLRRQSVRTTLWLGSVTFVLAVGSVLMLFPVFFMLTTSLKTSGNTFIIPIKWLPGIEFVPQWKNYPDALNFMHWSIVYGNTLKVSVTDMIADTVSAAVVAYGFARFRAPGRDL